MTIESFPLVSCIMPTFDRRAFVPPPIAHFQRQNYLNKGRRSRKKVFANLHLVVFC